jgi:hypothetical protein
MKSNENIIDRAKSDPEPHEHDDDLFHALQFRAHPSAPPAMAAGVISKLWEMADIVKTLGDRKLPK